MKKSVFAALFLILIGVIFGAVLVSNFDGVDLGLAQNKSVKLGAEKSPMKGNSELKALNEAFVGVAKEATPSVVSIVVTTKAKKPQDNEFFHFFPDFKFRMPEEEQTQGAGSGVIVTGDGYIITNNHVVEDAAEGGIEVVLSDTRRFKAKLVGTDPLTDVGVVKIDATDLPVAMLGNSDDLQVGQWAVAIGNPLALTSTVTAGIISYLGRNIQIIGDNYGVENFIQTDAAINPGNSGGALVNIYGEVIGINTAIATTNARYQGYGFAIPINLARTVAQDLILHGKVERGYIGVSISAVDATVAKAAGLEKIEGVLVQDLVEGGAAKDAGIKEGDIILSVDGKLVKAPNELQSIIAGRHPGEKVTLQIWRDKSAVEKIVTLKPRPDKSSVAANNSDNDNEGDAAAEKVSKPVQFDALGFSVSTIDPKVKKERKVESDIIVSNVKRYSEADNRQIQEGDVIVEADRKEVSTVPEFEKLVKSKKPGDALMLRVKSSNGASRFIAVQIPND
ncbi:MAG TPA: Do family serine endopeptidase [Bacteroidota bacterium]|nr:Do family serine endopeptidase [Bacteroidota bacterium]